MPRRRERRKPLLDADLLRADGAGYQTFDATEKRILRRVLIALLRQDMTTTGTTGIADNDPRQMSLWKCREDDATTYGDARCMTEWEDMGHPPSDPCVGSRATAPSVSTSRDGSPTLTSANSTSPLMYGGTRLRPTTTSRGDAEAKRGQQRAATLQALRGQGVRRSGRALRRRAPRRSVRDDARQADEDGNVPPEPLKTAPKPQGAGQCRPAPLAAPAALPAGERRPALRRTRDDSRSGSPCAAGITGDDLSGIQVRISAAGAPFHAATRQASGHR